MRVCGQKLHARNESDHSECALHVQLWPTLILGDRFEYEHVCQYPKDGELGQSRVKPGETLVEARSDTDVQIVRQTLVQGRKTNRTIQQLVPSEVSLRIAGVYSVLSCKANDQRDWGRLALDRFSNFEWARTVCYLIELTGTMSMTPSGPFLVSRTGDEG